MFNSLFSSLIMAATVGCFFSPAAEAQLIKDSYDVVLTEPFIFQVPGRVASMTYTFITTQNDQGVLKVDSLCAGINQRFVSIGLQRQEVHNSFDISQPSESMLYGSVVNANDCQKFAKVITSASAEHPIRMHIDLSNDSKGIQTVTLNQEVFHIDAKWHLNPF